MPSKQDVHNREGMNHRCFARVFCVFGTFAHSNDTYVTLGIAFPLFYSRSNQTSCGERRLGAGVGITVRRPGRCRVNRTARRVERLRAGGIHPHQRRRQRYRGSRVCAEGFRRRCRRSFRISMRRRRRPGGLPRGHAGELRPVRRLGSEFGFLGAAPGRLRENSIQGR